MTQFYPPQYCNCHGHDSHPIGSPGCMWKAEPVPAQPAPGADKNWDAFSKTNTYKEAVKTAEATPAQLCQENWQAFNEAHSHPQQEIADSTHRCKQTQGHTGNHVCQCGAYKASAQPAEMSAEQFYDDWSNRNAFTETVDLDSGWNKEGMVRFAKAYASALKAENAGLRQVISMLDKANISGAQRRRDLFQALAELCTKFVPEDEPINKLIHSIVQLSTTEDGMRVLRAKLYTEKLLAEARKDAAKWKAQALAAVTVLRGKCNEAEWAQLEKTWRSKMACMCGDLYCGSCGPAQGNFKCSNCGVWSMDGGCADPEACGKAIQAALEQECQLQERESGGSHE